MTVLGDPGTGLLPAGIGGSGSAGEEQLAAMEAILREGLAQGAVAVGPGSAYTPGAPITEIERMFRVAAAGGASAHIHLRGGVDGLRETLDAARSAGVPLHIVHVNSSAGVIVGGQVVVDGGAITTARPGRGIRAPRARKPPGKRTRRHATASSIGGPTGAGAVRAAACW